MNLKTIVKKITVIAEEAGNAIMEIYNNAESFQVETKKDESPLTIADKTANDIICKGLDTLEVKFPIISEENKAIEYDTRKDFEYCWLVDPLDGTKEFIKRNGEFTVNIALIHQGKIILGVVYAPALKEMFWAVKGEGAYQVINGEDKQLTCPPFNINDEGLKVVCSRSHINEDTENFINKLNNPTKVSIGSSFKFIIIAKGDAQVYPRLLPTMEWDTGAAQIILEEAGGSVIDNSTQKTLKYNKENLRNPYFVAYGNQK